MAWRIDSIRRSTIGAPTIATAHVILDDDVHVLTENQSIYIPLGSRHRLENPGRIQLKLIEVQTGSYLGEDDIIRYEDIYKRG